MGVALLLILFGVGWFAFQFGGRLGIIAVLAIGLFFMMPYGLGPNYAPTPLARDIV